LPEVTLELTDELLAMIAEAQRVWGLDELLAVGVEPQDDAEQAAKE